jgi:hypothetical protein
MQPRYIGSLGGNLTAKVSLRRISAIFRKCSGHRFSEQGGASRIFFVGVAIVAAKDERRCSAPQSTANGPALQGGSSVQAMQNQQGEVQRLPPMRTMQEGRNRD